MENCGNEGDSVDMSFSQFSGLDRLSTLTSEFKMMCGFSSYHPCKHSQEMWRQNIREERIIFFGISTHP